MQYPKISIITPSYQQGQYLETTILSVLNQNYPNLEYMIFDGASTDNSVEIIKKYESKLDFWLSEKDNGQSDAINKGFAKATGEIVTWLNSDDQLEEGTLFKIAEYFTQNPKIHLVHGQTLFFGDNISTWQSQPILKDLQYLRLSGMCFAQPAAFFKRASLEQFGFLNPAFHYAMDYDFFLQIALHHDFLQVNDLFAHYLIHATSKTTLHNQGFAKEYAQILSKLLRSFSFGKKYIQFLKDLDLYYEGSDLYSVGKNISEKDLERVFFYNLNSQLKFYYDDSDLHQSLKITSFLKENMPSFYAEHSELAQVYWRSKYLNKDLITFLRKIKKML
ncbi:MAG: glycosyltransferase [Bacteroidetes bacterium]|nr:MAG: glycosyltransferase [Bacteroidota bacterium]